MQPYSTHNQQFRYFDSKRPLVVSFRRINKMNQNNLTLEHCNSINDFHRIDIGGCGTNNVLICGKDSGNHDRATVKSLPKFNSHNNIRNGMAKCNNSHTENQSCRNFNYVDKHKAHFETQYDDDDDDDDDTCDRNPTITYPKEKFYGNAKLKNNGNGSSNCNNNEDILWRKHPIIDSREDEYNTAFSNNNMTSRKLMNKNRKTDQYQNLLKRQPQKSNGNDDDEEIFGAGKLNAYNKTVINDSQMSLNEINYRHNDTDSQKNFLQLRLSKLFASRNETENEITRINVAQRKCKSSPSLYKLSHFPTSLEMDCKKENQNNSGWSVGSGNNKGSFVSVLSAKRKEAFQFKNSKSC